MNTSQKQGVYAVVDALLAIAAPGDLSTILFMAVAALALTLMSLSRDEE